MAGWHHQLNGHEFGQTPGIGNGQGGLACYIYLASKLEFEGICVHQETERDWGGGRKRESNGHKLPTADNSVPLLEPQKRHASELLVVGFPRRKQKRKILLKHMFSTYFTITS